MFPQNHARLCAIAEQGFPDRDANRRIQLAQYPDCAESQAQEVRTGVFSEGRYWWLLCLQPRKCGSWCVGLKSMTYYMAYMAESDMAGGRSAGDWRTWARK
jgi:hypothetical protein